MNILRVEKSLPSKNFYSNRILRGNNHNEANAVPDFRIIIIIILSYYFVCIIFPSASSRSSRKYFQK